MLNIKRRRRNFSLNNNDLFANNNNSKDCIAFGQEVSICPCASYNRDLQRNSIVVSILHKWRPGDWHRNDAKTVLLSFDLIEKVHLSLQLNCIETGLWQSFDSCIRSYRLRHHEIIMRIVWIGVRVPGTRSSGGSRCRNCCLWFCINLHRLLLTIVSPKSYFTVPFGLLRVTCASFCFFCAFFIAWNKSANWHIFIVMIVWPFSRIGVSESKAREKVLWTLLIWSQRLKFIELCQRFRCGPESECF